MKQTNIGGLENEEDTRFHTFPILVVDKRFGPCDLRYCCGFSGYACLYDPAGGFFTQYCGDFVDFAGWSALLFDSKEDYCLFLSLLHAPRRDTSFLQQ